ncbi:MAG: ferrous iron transport protein A, partial [Catonella sp.]
IPKKDRVLLERYQTSLAQIEKTGAYLVGRVHDDFQLLNYLDKHQLHINQIIEVTAIDSYAQTYTIHYKQKDLTVPQAIAQEIYVERQ